MTEVSQEAREAEVTVTQADRNAAADLIETYWAGLGENHDTMRRLAQSYRDGLTQGVWAEAFARHRHQAERETLARMEWRGIESAPKACHVLAARFNEDCGEWQMQVTLSPPIYPFTHWMPLPPAPEAA